MESPCLVICFYSTIFNEYRSHEIVPLHLPALLCEVLRAPYTSTHTHRCPHTNTDTHTASHTHTHTHTHTRTHTPSHTHTHTHTHTVTGAGTPHTHSHHTKAYTHTLSQLFVCLAVNPAGPPLTHRKFALPGRGVCVVCVCVCVCVCVLHGVSFL